MVMFCWVGFERMRGVFSGGGNRVLNLGSFGFVVNERFFLFLGWLGRDSWRFFY